jgi:hypothetical protein
MNISALISGKLVQGPMFSRKVFVLAAFSILFSGVPIYAVAKQSICLVTMVLFWGGFLGNLSIWKKHPLGFILGLQI